jgi:hypothetical protein
VGVVAVTDHETITVALLYAALALVGPFVLSRLARWAESDDAANLLSEVGVAMFEIGMIMDEVAR